MDGVQKTLDDIIGAHACSPQLVKTKIATQDIVWLAYSCHEHRYSVRYSEDLEKAEYTFDHKPTEPVETPVSIKQRNYYVDSGYWKYEDQTKALRKS